MRWKPPLRATRGQVGELSGFVAAFIVACNARKERLLAGLIQLGELVADAQSLSTPQRGRQATMVVDPQAISTLLYFESAGWHLECGGGFRLMGR